MAAGLELRDAPRGIEHRACGEHERIEARL